MPTIDEELAQMERDIRQLKIEYDMFFGGGRKRPPTEIEWRIELIVKRYGERGGDMKFGQRFRFTNLTQTYAKYKDVFRKRMVKHEEGKIERHFGAAAKAIEAERARAQGGCGEGGNRGGGDGGGEGVSHGVLRAGTGSRQRSINFTKLSSKPSSWPAKRPAS